jgi:uncharacterized membrane protein
MPRELTLPIAIHLFAVLPAVILGVLQIATPKGTPLHRRLGWLWVAAMAVTALSSFWIIGPKNGGSFSVIHLLSVWVLFALGSAIWFIRRGNVRAHRYFMVGTLAGLVAAGIGAMVPGRLLSQVLF